MLFRSHEGLDCIISMFPRLRILHISGDVLKALGTPSERSTYQRPFLQTLKRLTLDGFERHYALTPDGRTTTTLGGRSFSPCHTQSLCELLAQFGVVQEVVISRIIFDSVDDLAVRGVPDPVSNPAWQIHSLTMNHTNSLRGVLGRLYAAPMTSLHLTSGQDLKAVLRGVPRAYVSQLEEVSLWAESEPRVWQSECETVLLLLHETYLPY